MKQKREMINGSTLAALFGRKGRKWQLDYVRLQSALLRQSTVRLAGTCFTDENFSFFCSTKTALEAQSTAKSQTQKSEHNGSSCCASIRLPSSFSLLPPYLWFFLPFLKELELPWSPEFCWTKDKSKSEGAPAIHLKSRILSLNGMHSVTEQ